MKNRVRAIGLVSFISRYYTESLRFVEIQSKRILFVYIDLCRSSSFRKFNKCRSIALTATVAVYKKHFYCVQTQPDESDIYAIIVGDGIEIYMREIVRNQRSLYLVEIFFLQKIVRSHY